jgi:hypothetical protein
MMDYTDISSVEKSIPILTKNSNDLKMNRWQRDFVKLFNVEMKNFVNFTYVTLIDHIIQFSDPEDVAQQ